MKNPSRGSVKELIREEAFCSYAVKFSLNDAGRNFYDLDNFVNALMYELSDFAYGGSYWEKSTPSNPTVAISEAAKALFEIPEFKKVRELYLKGGTIGDEIADTVLRRGEFGELILFFLLKNFNDAIPLVSKIYFKNHDNDNVHGFDAVHYHENTKSLWLGESKIYEDSKRGLQDLIKDVGKHVTSDYLKREFALIGKKFQLAAIEDVGLEKRDKIIDLLNSGKSLDEKLSSLVLPLLCTFSSKTFSDFEAETGDFLKAYQAEMYSLRDYFKAQYNHELKGKINIVLLLMPVKSKKELIRALHERLAAAQSLIQ